MTTHHASSHGIAYTKDCLSDGSSLRQKPFTNSGVSCVTKNENGKIPQICAHPVDRRIFTSSETHGSFEQSLQAGRNKYTFTEGIRPSPKIAPQPDLEADGIQKTPTDHPSAKRPITPAEYSEALQSSRRSRTSLGSSFIRNEHGDPHSRQDPLSGFETLENGQSYSNIASIKKSRSFLAPPSTHPLGKFFKERIFNIPKTRVKPEQGVKLEDCENQKIKIIDNVQFNTAGRVSDEVAAEWNSTVRPHLSTILTTLKGSANEHGDRNCIDLVVAKENDCNDYTPTTVIFCASAQRATEIKKRLNDREQKHWLRCCQFPCKVVHDTNGAFLPLGISGLMEGPPPTCEDTTDETFEVFVETSPSPPALRNGTEVYVARQELLSNAHTKLTLGGYIAIASGTYAITAAHTLTELGYQSSGAVSNLTSPQDIGSVVSWAFSGYQSNDQSNASCNDEVIPTNSDWALIELKDWPDVERSNPNLFIDPTGNERSISKVSEKVLLFPAHMSTYEVWIIAKNGGTLRGVANPGHTLIQMGGASFDAIRITLRGDNPLVKGTSGSWVVDESAQLCGMIVAGQQTLNWAFMIPINEVFRSIATFFGLEDLRDVQIASPLISDSFDSDIFANKSAEFNVSERNFRRPASGGNMAGKESVDSVADGESISSIAEEEREDDIEEENERMPWRKEKKALASQKREMHIEPSKLAEWLAPAPVSESQKSSNERRTIDIINSKLSSAPAIRSTQPEGHQFAPHSVTKAPRQAGVSQGLLNSGEKPTSDRARLSPGLPLDNAQNDAQRQAPTTGFWCGRPEIFELVESFRNTEKPQVLNDTLKFLDKVKNGFASNPDKYMEFLEICTRHQDGLTSVHDTFEEARGLFSFDAMELLDEFQQFLTLPTSDRRALDYAAAQGLSSNTEKSSEWTAPRPATPHVHSGAIRHFDPVRRPQLPATKRRASTEPHPSEPLVKKQSKWTAEENDLIVKLRGDGLKWREITRHLPGRSELSCRLHYQNFLERRPLWNEEQKNKLARLYVRYRKEMWDKVAEELHMPWRAAEDMHWTLGKYQMAERAAVTPVTPFTAQK